MPAPDDKKVPPIRKSSEKAKAKRLERPIDREAASILPTPLEPEESLVAGRSEEDEEGEEESAIDESESDARS
eukprot:6677677-Heterocapsa_arctica.AAC.1